MSKPWPKDRTKQVDFEDLVTPLATILRTKKLPKNFDNIYNIGDSSLACSPPIDDTLTPDGMAYHLERDRDLFDVVLGIAIQYGSEQGVRGVQRELDYNKKMVDHLIKSLPEPTPTQKKRAIKTIKKRIKKP